MAAWGDHRRRQPHDISRSALGEECSAATASHGELVHAGGFSFPSTDAALSVVLIAIAIAVERVIGNAAPRGRLVVIGMVLTAVTGVLLVAARVHYLTDVLGGWGLGAAVFAASGLLAYALAAAARGSADMRASSR